MEEMVLEKNETTTARRNVETYFRTHDVSYLTEDAVFTNLGTGDEYKGREAVAGMLHYIYHVAFDARAEVKNVVVTDGKAVVEADFRGRHIGELAGIKPTGKEVNVPFCVCYDLEGDLIKRARIYMLGEVLMKQIAG